ncbi:hypothetical protein HYX00_02335 [Candidatus Woesearchaeota archaeon]|nr:hypothetical protein [Candidatus Woesearchaeota archaeon]
MAKKNLIDYVQSLIQKGYDVSTIRNFLLKYRYTEKEIDNAINSSYKPTIRHEIHLSHTTVFVVIFIFISLLGTVLFFYFNTSKAETKLLDLNLEPITTTVRAGESITFLKELSNLGSAKRYDVIIKQEIIDSKTSKVITQKIETRAIETFGSTQTRILIPENTKAGDYILRAIIEYDGKKAIATLPIKVTAFTKRETEKQSLNCDDNNPCTNDAIEDSVCVNSPIVPCCGNNICEMQEQESCAADCPKTAEPSSLISTENSEEIKEIARVNPSKALQQCNQIEIPDLKDTCIGNIGEVQRNKNYCSQINNTRIKDLCYSTIAKSINDNSLCKEISTDSRRDSCYMTFVLDNKDYSVCDKITNKHLRQSCESLKQFSELNQQQNQNQATERAST